MIQKTEIDVDALLMNGVFVTDYGLTAAGGALVFKGKPGSLQKFANELTLQAARQTAREAFIKSIPKTVDDVGFIASADPTAKAHHPFDSLACAGAASSCGHPGCDLKEEDHQ